VQVRAFLAVFALQLEAAHDLVGVQAQVVGIGAHESDGVGAPGQGVEAGLFDGFDVTCGNAQRRRDVVDLFLDAQARGPQKAADAAAVQVLHVRGRGLAAVASQRRFAHRRVLSSKAPGARTRFDGPGSAGPKPAARRPMSVQDHTHSVNATGSVEKSYPQGDPGAIF
jgi:hypothetical protein